MLQVSLCGDEGREEEEKHGFSLPMSLCPPGSRCLLRERPQCSDAAADHPHCIYSGAQLMVPYVSRNHIIARTHFCTSYNPGTQQALN